MDLRRLRHFSTVAQELHFGRAAEKLGMTQPPLSQSIQGLEGELGVRLFERTKRTVTLTAVGLQWLPYVRRVLEDAAALPNIARRLSRGEVGILRLAFVSIADYHVLPRLISQYRTRYPEVEISLQESTSDLQIEDLLEGRIDAGLIIPPPQMRLPATLSYRQLVREPLVAAVPEEWIKARRIRSSQGRISFENIAHEPLIIFPRRSAPAFHDVITGYYAGAGIEPIIGQEAIQMQTIVSLVSAGLGIALVPQSLQSLGRLGVRYLTFEGQAPEIETGVVWRAEDPLPALRHFLALTMETLG